LILGDTAPEALIDEPRDEETDEIYLDKDFEKIDLFLQKTYHFYADEPRWERLQQMPLLDQNEGIRIYDGKSI